MRYSNLSRGIPHLDLRPGEVLSVGLAYVSELKAEGYVVRVTQVALEGDSRRTIGGQTFVVGEVEGYTARNGHGHTTS